jgi:hypothetical protein
MNIRLSIGMIALGSVVALACNGDVSAPDDRGLAPGSAEPQLGAGSASEECSLGDAQALLETVPVANEIFLREGPDQPWANTLLTCQYRLFWESGHPILGPITFNDEDFFLGGVVFRLPYANLGMSLEQAEAALAAIDVRIAVAEVTKAGVGELIPQPVLESAFKQTKTDGLGLILYKQFGFITQLPPGEYVSVTEVRRPVFFEDEFVWTVSFHII